MTDFQQGLMELQGSLPQGRIASVILGPYHGWGPCDGAIHVAEDALYRWAGNNKKPLSKELALKRFGEVKNHEARVMPSPGWPINNKVGTFTGIGECFHFEFDPDSGRIFGWGLSDDAAADQKPHATWPLEKKSNKRPRNMYNN